MFIIRPASCLFSYGLLSLAAPIYATNTTNTTSTTTDTLLLSHQEEPLDRLPIASPLLRNEQLKKGINYRRLALLAGSGALVDYTAFKYFDRAWYQNTKQDNIRWLRDWYGDAYLDLDKGGHFMSGLFMARTLTEAYSWTGFGHKSAAVLGTVTSWAGLMQVEMRDAYFANWGFSIPDFFYNTLGASVPLIHTLVPATQAVNFKFSYHPSRLYLNHEDRAAQGQPHTDFIIDDYEGMTFWMTFAVNNVLWGRAEEAWPDYLGLALGYGATGLHGSNVKSKGRFKYYKDLPDARPEFFLSFDYDARYLPGKGPFWSFFKERLNFIHFPSPALRVYPEWRFYLIYM
jgi:hypothetical protein